MKRPGKMIREVLGSLFRKPITILYPFVKAPIPPRFRAKLKFTPSLCIGCKLCVRDCPANAIEIIKVGEKQFECRIDLAKCIYCAQCVDSCPKKALQATEEFELASLDRQSLVVSTKPDPASAPAKPEPGTKPDEPGKDTPK
jgi:formate hydrogenlyase subunit 6/NADH:ubiquinone oxidoreductase subunit I